MTVTFRFGFLAFWLSLTLSGCATLPTPVDTGQLFLWEIQGAQPGGGVAHVLGSVHFGNEGIDFDPAIDRALADAETLVFEVAPADMDPAAMLQIMLELGRLPEGQTLDAILPEATWSAVEARLSEAGLPAANFAFFEPWVVMIQVIGLDVAAAGLEASQGVESQLIDAETEERPALGLETARFQLELFDQLPLETQIALLDETLATGSEENGEGINLILAAWEAGDDRLLLEMTAPEGRDEHSRLFFERVFTARNLNMADQIVELLQRPTRYFITIGAGHTVGDTGVPELLRERGYRVRRLPRTTPTP